MKKLIAGLLAVAAIAIASPARADDTGFSFGLRAGYGLGMGDAVSGSALSDGISGTIPLWLDVNYRFTKNISAGAYFQYGLAFVNSNLDLGGGATCSTSGISCSASQMRFGIEGFYNFMPDATFAPWVGLNVGYEIASMKAEAGGVSQTVNFKGFEFVGLQVGGDYKVSPAFSIGPFLTFNLGQYSTMTISQTGQPDQEPTIQTAMHEWLQFGVKGTFNL